MARWILLLLAVVGFVISFTTKSAALLGIGIVLIFVGTFGVVLSVASARISDNARPDSAMASTEDLVALRKPRLAPQPPAQPPPPRNPEAPR